MEYLRKNRKSLIMLIIAMIVILVSSFFASMIQSAGFSVTVTDIRNESNSGKLYEENGITEVAGQTVRGEVVSGILFMPNDASASNKLPAVVMTHGYLNNRELQLQNAIELARRGFIVITIDREGHGNYLPESDIGSAMMTSEALYEAVKYAYNLPEVDKTRVGVTGHSMGGFSTAMAMASDLATGGRIISAGLMQGWSSFMGAGANVSVGNLKAMDDEFFYQSKFADGTASICREYLHSTGAASFVGVTGYGNTKDAINIQNDGIYINGRLTTVKEGTQASAPFRVIYENNEIHPLNHFSTASAADVVNFFYTAFGTPDGHDYIASGSQTWWIKEAFSTIGLAAFFFMIFPLVSCLLALPCFASLKKGDEVVLDSGLPSIKKGGAANIVKVITMFATGLATMLFGGFILRKAYTEWSWIVPQGSYFPQDTTGNVAAWAMICGGFALFVMLVMWLINACVAKAASKRGEECAINNNPFSCAKIDLISFIKTIILAVFVVGILYFIVWVNWGLWTVDFRLWTLDVKPFMMAMIPAMTRYIPLFFIFYAINAIGNAGFRFKDLPEWASIAINAFFNAAGVLLVILIQYITFRSTGVLWQSDMNLGYIVVFPLVPVLAIATIISRLLYKKTGNIWLGAMLNAILFTVITCANTAAGYMYTF